MDQLQRGGLRADDERPRASGTINQRNAVAPPGIAGRIPVRRPRVECDIAVAGTGFWNRIACDPWHAGFQIARPARRVEQTAADVRERPAGVDLVVEARKRIDAVVSAAAHIAPRGAIPAREMAGRSEEQTPE